MSTKYCSDIAQGKGWASVARLRENLGFRHARARTIEIAVSVRPVVLCFDDELMKSVQR